MSAVHNHEVHVLVVDPDHESRRVVHEAILADGYSCTAVASADEALSAAAIQMPSLLICDVNLGNESGIELFATMKQENPDCPALFTSNSRRAETLQHARRAGGTYFLSKPIDPTVLMELVDKALWMPHLVRRHVDSAAHGLKAPSFAPSVGLGSR